MSLAACAGPAQSALEDPPPGPDPAVETVAPPPPPIADPPTVELAAFEPCGTVGKGFLPRPEEPAVRVEHHDLVVGWDGLAPSIDVEDHIVLRVERASRDMLLFVRAPFAVDNAAILGEDGNWRALTCQMGALHDEPYVRLVFPDQLQAGATHHVVVATRAPSAAIALETAVHAPVPIAQSGQIAPLPAYFTNDDWYPHPLLVEPVTATLFLELPEGLVAAAFGAPARSASGRVAFVLEAPTKAPIGWVAAPAEGARSLVREGRATIRVLTAADHPDPDALLLDWQDKVVFLEAQLGAWSGSEIVLAEVQPSAGEAAAKPLGLVILSSALLRDPAQGNSYAFDLLARQWLELSRPVDPRLVEGIVQVLAAQFTSETDPVAAAKQIETLRTRYSEATTKHPYTPLHRIGLFDEMVEPIVFAKAGVVLSMLADTLGREDFAAGLQGWLAAGSAEERNIDGLQAAMESVAGAHLASFFDRFFRATGELSVQASCKDGKVVVEQLEKQLVAPYTFEAVSEKGEVVLVRFEKQGVAVTEVACEKAPQLTAPRSLARFK